ncbi:MAG: TrkH family potassium uptake protein [Kiritimatiellae bacterium]|nr:TrkH family potassium uptake protein [Kiritimatiellia bacterium]
MALGFLSAIIVGSALLSLPKANASGDWMSPLTALFTATSATCVTGLTVIDIGTELTLFGQVVVLSLIQLGGLGITTFGTFLLVLVGRRLSVQSEFVLMDAYGVDEVNGLRSLLLWTVAFTLFFEGIGALLLWPRYLHAGVVSSSRSLYYAVFHAVSAFCNAGFSLHADSLISFRNDPAYLYSICFLIICGGLGFLVLYNIITIKFWRRNLKTRGRITLHTKIVLSATLLLIVIGTAIFALLEWGNTLDGLPLHDKFTNALFHSITPRTAGFNVVPMGAIRELTRFTTTLLMFVGGSPGSAAGGIKTTTIVVLFMTIIAMCKNRHETVIFSRTLPYAVVREAIVIFLLAIFWVLTAYGIMLWTEFPKTTGDSSKLFFETVSAFATVGLSINHTDTLSNAGRCVIIVCMFVGRLGPLAVALMIGNREELQRIRYPQEEVVVG